MRKFLLTTCVVLCTVLASAQEKVTLNGYVRDASNGEELLGVTVLVVEIGNGVISNDYGFYSITLAPGNYTVKYSFIGY